MDDSITMADTFSPNEWHLVNENDASITESLVKTPEEFLKEVEELKVKFNLQTPDMWQKNKDASHEVKH